MVLSEPAGEIDLATLRQQITMLVSKHAVDMVSETIEQVHQGHYQALRYLFDMIGLYPATAPSEHSEEDSLAATLLKHLGVAEPLAQQNASPRGAGDAVQKKGTVK